MTAKFRFANLPLLVVLLAGPAIAQTGSRDNPPPPPPPPPAASQSTAPGAAEVPQTPEPLGQLVGRIALYPDPLLAQVLAASTYWDEVPEAAEWAGQHRQLRGEALTEAVREDNLQWDPSVLALLPFPSVLHTMARDPAWTRQLGRAVLTRRADVMDAVQAMRSQAHRYGYLRTTPYDTVVDSGGYLEVLPVNPAYIYVPSYDPYVVFGPPSPGLFVGGAIRFGPAIVIEAGFYPWGWERPYFAWGSHLIFFDETPWGRSWANRAFYLHSYAHPWLRELGRRVERHGVSPARRRP
jgi:hypothetical protein